MIGNRVMVTNFGDVVTTPIAATVKAASFGIVLPKFDAVIVITAKDESIAGHPQSALAAFNAGDVRGDQIIASTGSTVIRDIRAN